MTSYGLFTISIIGYASIIIASLFIGKILLMLAPQFIKRLEQLTDKRSKIILLCAMIIIASFFTWYAFQKYDGLGYYVFDQGNMEQTIWNTVHGDWFRLTTQEPATNRLHFHVEPIFLLLAPIYALWESGKVLLLIQILILVSGCYAVFRIARNKGLLPLYSLIFAVSYLLFPIVWRNAVTDFHPLTLGASFMIFGALFAFEKKYGLSVIFFLLALASREEYAVMISLFGVILFFLKDRKFSYFLMTIGAVWTLFVLLVVIPAFSPTESLLQTNYYSYIFDQGINIREFILSRLAYILLLLGPLLFLSVRSPFILIGVVSFLTILFRKELPFFMGAFHNHVSLLPAIYIPAVLGFRDLTAKKSKHLRIIGLSLCVSSVGFFLFFLFSPPGMIPEEDRFFKANESREIRVLLSRIPKNASVLSTNEFGELLPARKNMFVLQSADFLQQEYAVIPEWKESFCPVWSRGSDACNANENLYKDSLVSLSANGKYDLLGGAYGVYVYKRVGE